MYTLRSDHGKFVSAEDGGAPQGTIDGRPAGLMTANRDSAGGWESFTIEKSDEPDFYGIKSTHGFFACCEDEGKAGYVAFNREGLTAWEKFKLVVRDNGEKISFESQCRPGYFIKVWGDGRVSLDQPMWENQPSPDPGGYETFTIDPPFKSGVIPGKSVIQGQLRIDSAGYVDDVGRVLPIGIHIGDLFSKFVRDRAHAQNLCSQASAAGYPLIHFWMNLGTLGDYWSGRECGPGYTDNFWGELGALGDLLDSYGLKGGYNLGDYKLWSGDHISFFSQLGDHLSQRSMNTAAYVFGGNEAWQTGADSVDEIKDALNAFRAHCATVICTTTAPPSESAEDIAEWCSGDFYAIHGYRDAEDHDRIRHIFSVPWEGHPPDAYGWQDEPTGPGDGVSVKASHCYNGRDVDANHMCALAVQSLMCNQGFNYFCEDGVKSDGDITRWAGFHEVAKVIGFVPVDIMGWPGPLHFGGSQSHNRVFSPLAENTLRFDHRLAHDGRIFGIFYGDEGSLSAKCERACTLDFLEMDGTVTETRSFTEGQTLTLSFRRSQGGQPGYTAQVVRGYMA